MRFQKRQEVLWRDSLEAVGMGAGGCKLSLAGLSLFTLPGPLHR